MRIMDVLGKEIKNIKFSGKQITLERGDLSPGIYSLQIVSEGEIISNEKIIIQ